MCNNKGQSVRETEEEIFRILGSIIIIIYYFVHIRTSPRGTYCNLRNFVMERRHRARRYHRYQV